MRGAIQLDLRRCGVGHAAPSASPEYLGEHMFTHSSQMYTPAARHHAVPADHALTSVGYFFRRSCSEVSRGAINAAHRRGSRSCCSIQSRAFSHLIGTSKNDVVVVILYSDFHSFM